MCSGSPRSIPRVTFARRGSGKRDVPSITFERLTLPDRERVSACVIAEREKGDATQGTLHTLPGTRVQVALPRDDKSRRALGSTSTRTRLSAKVMTRTTCMARRRMATSRSYLEPEFDREVDIPPRYFHLT